MVVHTHLPDQSATTGIQGVCISTQVAEICDVTAGGFRTREGDGGTNCPVRLEAPIGASGRCIQREHLSAGAAHKYAPAHNGRLRESSAVSWEAEGPLHLEPGNIGGAQPWLGLITGIVRFDAPSVPIARCD